MRPTRVLGPLSLEVPAGRSLAVVGPSGSGKSTLLSIIGCLERPTSGGYYLQDQAVADLGEAELAKLRRERFGFVFQRFHLIPELSVLDNVSLPLLYQGASVRAGRREAALALERVSLAAKARARPYQLSGGEQQRVAVARAAVSRPTILLADEPTGNLDSANGALVVELLLSLRRENPTGILVMVTHNLALARRLDSMVFLEDGILAEPPATTPQEGCLVAESPGLG